VYNVIEIVVPSLLKIYAVVLEKSKMYNITNSRSEGQADVEQNVISKGYLRFYFR
jgi:hypothetical protein